jgi:hypothetical protein
MVTRPRRTAVSDVVSHLVAFPQIWHSRPSSPYSIPVRSMDHPPASVGLSGGAAPSRSSKHVEIPGQ